MTGPPGTRDAMVFGAARRSEGPRNRAISLATVMPLLLAVIVGCSAGSPGPAGDPSTDPGRLPSAQLHDIGIDPRDGKILLSSDVGLFEVDPNRLTFSRGPAIDIEVLAVAGDRRYLASGHPAGQADLPEPAGLLSSTDGGQTWTSLSRGGQSDFRALTVSAAGILGYDGALVRSTDGRTWGEVGIPAEPLGLAAAPDGSCVVATTSQGLLRSTDGGTSWSAVEGAPSLRLIAWADSVSAVGVDRNGTVWTSTDAASTWQQRARLSNSPRAVAATIEGSGIRVVVLTRDAVLDSEDGGRMFEVVLQG